LLHGARSFKELRPPKSGNHSAVLQQQCRHIGHSKGRFAKRGETRYMYRTTLTEPRFHDADIPKHSALAYRVHPNVLPNRDSTKGTQV
jgi:hypothetical protein